MSSEIKSEAARDILAYLTKNPAAQDALEGIAEWWMLELSIQHSVEIVKQAMDELVANGYVEERRGADGRSLYRLKRGKTKEIEAVLRRRKT